MSYFTAQADGTVSMDFSRPMDYELVTSIAEHLRNLIMGTQLDPDADIELPLKRLFPVAYVDTPQYELQYRRLTRDELLNSRLEQLQILERCNGKGVLQPDEIQTFMQALNALRLVMGTVLDVSEQDDSSHVYKMKPEDISLEEFAHLQFQFLGNLLGQLVDAADQVKDMPKKP